MLIVALTGGIASGKSVVAKILEELGCYIHNADKIAHDLMEPEKPVWKKIVAHFGIKILNEDKTINRSRLGKIIFSDEKERRFLNELIHPLVLEKKKEIINRIEKEGHYNIFISEAALTIEAGFADFFDKIIMTYCKKEVQIERLMERDGISQKQAMKKIKSQMQPQEKLKYADYIIDTSGSLQSTVEQTERVYRNLMMDNEMKNTIAKYES
ncbi:MAG: dephospho-CoA kinase [candidate division Zixibacteria bacterium SM1_73]|nr:MAG: dephospho-CoA kinase [candidate division Zixibacteria bacterium SM1_73]